VSIMTSYILASFSEPQAIGMNPQSMLWLLPLVAAIAIVYKTTKIPKIKPFNFIKDVVILFGSIVVFMAITAVILYVFAWLIIE